MNKLPFSKKVVNYARWEAYVFTAILFIMAFLNVDTSSFSVALLSLAWGGYKALQMFYINMAKREHLEEIRYGRLHSNLDTSDIDAEIEELENEDIESEDDCCG